MSIRLALTALVFIATAIGTSGCPLTIEVRCERPADCPPEETCASGVCRPGLRPADDGGASVDGGTVVPDGGTNAGNDAGGDAGTEDGGDAGKEVDAGCVADVPLDQPCTSSCRCAQAGAQCQGTCVLGCSTDFQCPSGRRCEEGACRVGPRLGDPCTDTFECVEGFCDLTRKRCYDYCANDGACSPGYRCAPDGYCIERCDETPATLGLTCENSYDCPRCGVCVADGTSVLRCHRLCELDRDCGDAGTAVCEDRTNHRVCRL